MFNFGTNNSTAAKPATVTGTSGFSFGNSATATTAANSTASLTAQTAVKPGLGGSGYTSGQNDQTKTETSVQQPIKQQTLPKEINQLVTGLEEYIKKEKDESNEVAKYSQRQLHKIKDNADTLEILIRSLKSNLQKETSSVKNLSEKAVELQKCVAMAQRTNDTHAALQHENHLPSRYFGELIKDFESTLMVYRAQIENLESHLAAGNEAVINQLPHSIERLHQTFIALAANLHIVLAQLSKLKQRYLAYRRQCFGETADVFTEKSKSKSEEALVGPSPFAELSNLSVLALAQMQSQQQQQQPAPAQATGGNTGGGLFGNSSNTGTGGGLFGNTSSTNTGGGLFGNSSNTGTGGGLFGNTSSTNTGGGLFGNTSSTGGGGLFGNSKSATGGLFGNTTTTTSSSGGGLFGGTKSSFSFGSSAPTTTQSTGGGLFGNSSSTFSFGAKK